jgi:ribosomal protein S18 acetylase RimI-like enzyme
MAIDFDGLATIGRRQDAVTRDPALDAKRRAMPFLLCEYAHAMGLGLSPRGSHVSPTLTLIAHSRTTFRESTGYFSASPQSGCRRWDDLVVTDLLRRARVDDLPMVWRGEVAYMRAIEPEHEARWTAAADRHLTSWLANLDRTLVLEADGEPVGYAAWRAVKGRAVLQTIHVFEGFRRGGRGAALLQAYMNDARTFGCTDLALGVFAGNPAQALYEKHGFQYTHEEGGYRYYELTLLGGRS